MISSPLALNMMPYSYHYQQSAQAWNAGYQPFLHQLDAASKVGVPLKITTSVTSGSRTSAGKKRCGSETNSAQAAQAQDNATGPDTKGSASRYKTELCRTFQEVGYCRYANKCQFAHGVEELRNVARHPKYKTEMCRNYHKGGYCAYGTRCLYKHNEEVSSSATAAAAHFSTSCVNPAYYQGSFNCGDSTGMSPTPSLTETDSSSQSVWNSSGSEEEFGFVSSPVSPNDGSGSVFAFSRPTSTSTASTEHENECVEVDALISAFDILGNNINNHAADSNNCGSKRLPVFAKLSSSSGGAGGQF